MNTFFNLLKKLLSVSARGLWAAVAIVSILTLAGHALPAQAYPNPGAPSPAATQNKPNASLALLPGWNTVLSEDFEGAFPGTQWTAYDAGDGSYGGYYWGTDDTLAHTGSMSAWPAKNGVYGSLDPAYDNYPAYINAWMVAGPFDLSAYSAAELNFSYNNDSESGYDFLGWHASINGTDFYGANTSGNSGDWVNQRFDLTTVPSLGNLAGQPAVWIAFSFTSDGSAEYRGPFLDDVVLRAFNSSTPPPESFSKSSPTDGATLQPTQNLDLQWAASNGVFSYEICIDTVNDTTCDTSWQSAGSATHFLLSGLAPLTPYYWQVRAVNPNGTTEANAGAWWSLTTNVDPPGNFSRLTPTDGATDWPTSLTLQWESSSGADRYEYCYDTIGGATCSASWTDNGTSLTAALSGLSANTTYYWQVRAVNAGGTLYAGGNTWWSFTTQTPPPPADFGKIYPQNEATLAPFPSIALQWEASAGADSYQICINIYYDNCSPYDGSWQSANSATSFLVNDLAPSTTYYWQVRATNVTDTTYADGYTTWSFTTNTNPPGSFSRNSPADGATGVSLNPTLSWGTSSGANNYEYCYDIIGGATCSGQWIDNGTSQSVDLSALAPSTTYYWQVRAVNTGGTTYADGNYWWSFAVPPPPADFGKTTPTNGALDQFTSLSLSWNPSAGADSYSYCYDTTGEAACTGSWVSTGTNLSVSLSGLLPTTQYYWQVKAINSSGETFADAGALWSFTTTVNPPASFTRSSPADGAVDQALNPSLQWESSPGADRFEYCYDTTGGESCSGSWTDNQTSLTVALTGLTRGTTYYWQVRAVNAGGATYAGGNQWWSFTTIPQPPTNFSKIGPADQAVNQATSPGLSWEASSGAASYSYCFDTTDDNDCSTSWIPVGAALNATPVGLIQNTRYYWQVKAINPGGETGANTGAGWSFTTRPSQNWIVTNTNDSGAGSLRQAIQDSGPGETITFDPALAGQTILLASGLRLDWNRTISGAGLTSHIRISGNDGVRPFTISQGVTAALEDLDLVHGFSTQPGGGVNNAGTLTITHCTFSENTSRSYGGGLYNSGTLTITASTFSSNASQGTSGSTGSTGGYNGGAGGPGGTGSAGKGGGLYNTGNLSMQNVTLEGNTATGGQGGRGGQGGMGAMGTTGLRGMDGASIICYSNRICWAGNGTNGGRGGPGGMGGSGGSGGNGGNGLGGGLYNLGTAVLNNVTLSSNTTVCGSAGSGGSGGSGGLGGMGGAGGSAGRCTCVGWPCTCTNGLPGLPGSTGSNGSSGFSGSSGSTGTTFGGGVYNESGSLTFRNTLAASNQATTGIDGYGQVTLQGPSLIEKTAGITLLGEPEAVITSAPQFGPLQDNGGAVFTRALLKGSPAIDSGSALYCPVTDARGLPRPMDGNADGTAACDLGAFEYYLPPAVVSITRLDPTPGGAASVRFSVLFDQPVFGVDAGDFSLTASGPSGTALVAVNGSGGAYTVSVNTGTGDGTLRLDLSDDDSIHNASGDPLGDIGVGNGSFTGGETYTIDKTPPDTLLSGHPAGITNSPAANFTFSSPDLTASFECKLDTAEFNACPNPKDYSGLSEGAHTFQVRAIDSASNPDPTPAAFTWTVDTTPPDTLLNEHPTGITNSPAANFTFSSPDLTANFECKLDTAQFGVCVSPKDYANLSEGFHTFQVRAIDPASNADATPIAFTWTVDTIAPTGNILINNGAPDTRNGIVQLQLSAQDSGICNMQVRNGGESWGAWIQYSPTLTWNLPAGLGQKRIEARFRDCAGNESPVYFAIITLKGPLLYIYLPSVKKP